MVASAAGIITRHARPLAWQETRDGRRTPVNAAYMKSRGDEISFRLGHYNPSNVLIIDPVLTARHGAPALSVGRPPWCGTRSRVCRACKRGWLLGALAPEGNPIAAGAQPALTIDPQRTHAKEAPMSIRHARSLRTAGVLATMAIVVAGLSPIATAQSPAASNDATIEIGSLYEPQNLDNTAGGGQGVTEAFNGNVYEGLFKLTDDGKVEPLLAEELHRQRGRPDLHVHAASRRHVPLRQGRSPSADVKYSIERVIAEDSQVGPQEQLRGHQRASRRPTTGPSSSRSSSTSISLPLQPELRLDRQRQGRDGPHDHRGRHRARTSSTTGRAAAP